MITLNDKQNEFKMLSYPTWKRVGSIDYLQYDELIPSGKTSMKGFAAWREQGVKIHTIANENNDLNDVLYNPLRCELEEIDTYSFGSNRKLVLQAETNFNMGYVVNVPADLNIIEPLIIDFKIDKGQVVIDQTIIKLGKNASATVILRYTEEEKPQPALSKPTLNGNTTSSDNASDNNRRESGYHNGLIKVYVEQGAVLTLSKLQFLNDSTIHIHNMVSLIHEDAAVKLTTFDFGGQAVITDYSAHLVGKRSNSTVHTSYIGEGSRKLDIGYNTVHYGERSESIVECKGALMGESIKIFRGNLKFIRGAVKSKGRESEYVLLLDEHVHSDAIPALLCDEDDVSGEHAASAGQVNEQQLFYLMTRGFSLKEAKKLIIHGSFSTVIDLLPSQELKDQVESELERRLIHAK